MRSRPVSETTRLRQGDHSISNLTDRPDFASIIAERIWRAWWRAEGSTLADVEALVAENLRSTGIPFALVAHRGETFLGTASVIANDLKARPTYGPWIAAVWVEPEGRGTGIGSGLVRAAAMAAFRLPIERLYLNATPANAPFYDALGWQRIEENVDGLAIFSMTRSHPAVEGLAKISDVSKA
jgi:GNAT superfamily N-acetyltransferase